MASQKQPSPPGKLIAVGGFRLHALVQGTGKPAVILEPALGGCALQYALIQAAVSELTQVVSYDRAGQGWSDVSPTPRTPAHLVDELRALLDKLDVQSPYVLVGHSFGGMLTRIFAGHYPNDVAGMVLVDATHVDEYEPFPDVDDYVRRMSTGVRLLKLASKLGLGKQLTRLSLGGADTVPKSILEPLVTVMSQPKHQETMLAEFSQHRCYFGKQSEVPRTLGAIPLMIVTAEKSVSGKQRMGTLTGDQMNELHLRLQKDLVRLSSRGEQIMVPGATHLSIIMQPAHASCVANAITRVVQTIRNGNNCSHSSLS